MKPGSGFAARMAAFNEAVAKIGTEAFSSIWAFYLFMVWGLLGLLPRIPAGFKEFVLLVSSAWIQLWALPLLMVGNAVLNKAAVRQAHKDHEMLIAELKLMKALQMENHEMHLQILEMVKKLESAGREDGKPLI